jgi:enoyl-CoA hydratase/carnithine racemase
LLEEAVGTEVGDMSAGFETLELDEDQGLAVIRLNRPEALNAINQQMLLDLDAALDRLEESDDVRVIALTGTGRAFSAGRDLKEIGGDIHRSGAEVWARLESIPKPVIAAVNGLCYTGALSMLLAVDLVVAADTAVFADTHAKFGMFHGGGTTQRLRELVGPRRAKELLFTCVPISAAEAERIGLVNRVVPAGELMNAVRELAQTMSGNDPQVLGAVKDLVNRGVRWGSAIGLELENREYTKQRRERRSALKDRTDAFFGGDANED